MRRLLAEIASGLEWAIIAVAMLAAIGMFERAQGAQPESCGMECASYAVQALEAVGMRLRTVPAVVATQQFRHIGVYAKGVVYVHDASSCRVMVHEFVHHYQWLASGQRDSEPHMWSDEITAAGVTTLAVQAMAARGISERREPECD